MIKPFKKDAFTLVEILVVATIIGLLASVGLFSYTQFSKQSRDAKRKSDLEVVRSALELYRSSNNTYPLSVTWGGDICDPGGCIDGTYLKNIPNDPKASQNITYYYTSDGIDYTLGASMEGSDTNSCGDCNSGAGTQSCNYCVGPYGVK
ncbi:MAG: hypothetical protein RI947_560 [Candidatus Parcubacteria bacterium]|jgi:general secretion pathway protein G